MRSLSPTATRGIEVAGVALLLALGMLAFGGPAKATADSGPTHQVLRSSHHAQHPGAHLGSGVSARGKAKTRR